MHDPQDELRRLNLVRRLEILDSPREAVYDALVELAADVTGFPAAVLTLCDGERQWFKASVGMDVRESAIDGSLCAITIGRDEPWVVPDFAADPTLHEHPARIGSRRLGSYVGVPVRCGGGPDGGLCVAALAVFGPEARPADPRHIERLSRIALAIGRLFDQRLMRVQEANREAARATEQRDASENAAARIFDELPGMLYRCANDADWTLMFASAGVLALTGYQPEELVGNAVTSYAQLIHADDRQRVADEVDAAVREQRPFRMRYRLRTASGQTKWVQEQGRQVADGALEGYVADISDQVQVELDRDALREASQGARKEVEQLSQQAALMRIAGRMARTGGWSLDLAADRVWWSPEIFDILEVPHGEEPPLSETLSWYPPEWRPIVTSAVERCASVGEPFDLELEILTRSGRRLRVRAAGEAQRDPDGSIRRVVGVFLDISEAHAAKEALRVSRERYEVALAGSAAAIWDWDIVNETIFLSDRYFELLGYRPGETSRTIEEYFSHVYPEDREPTWAAVQAHLAQGVPYRAEYRMRHRTLGYRWFSAEGTAVRDAQGKPTRMAGSIVDIHERRSAEASALEAAEALRTTFESITDGFFTLTRDWRFGFLNAQAERLLGRSRGDLESKGIFEEFPHAIGTQFEHAYREAMDSGVSVTFEEYYPEPLDRWFAVRAFPSSGGLAVYFQDVTDARAARTALIESEERFRLLSRATSDAIWDWNLRTNELWWNDGYEQLFGYTPAQRAPDSTSWSAFIHPEDAERVLSGIHKAIEERAVAWQDEYRFLCEDGSYRIVLDRGHLICDADGEAVRMVGGMTDLTDRLLDREQLRKQAAFIDQASDAILELDLEGNIQFWNHGAERIYRFSATEARGQELAALLNADPVAVRSSIDAVRQTGRWAGEREYLTRSGDSVTTLGRWTLLNAADGSPRSILIIDTDVTERRKIEQQFLRSQRMESIGTLAGGIAHDLNNVLAPILLSIELLKEDERDPMRLETIETIEGSAKRGADMVRQVLSFARGVEGRRVDLQIRHVVDDVAKIARDTFPKNIQLNVSIPADLWVVPADPTQLHQVLLNLCVNARDAMPMGGPLWIRANNVTLDEQYAKLTVEAKPGPHIVIEVEDRGHGMTDDVLEKIFDPFFTTKALGRGTGLGLSTSLAIIRSHGGFVRAYSEPGQGSRFRIYLPANVNATASDIARASLALKRGAGELILVVDDEASVRDVTKATLESFGYRVRLATDGADAVSQYATLRDEIALVLTDVMMPIMDGTTLVQILRRMNPAVRVVAVSGLASDGRLHHIAHLGVRHFLPKPYTAETLLSTIRSALEDEGANGTPVVHETP